MAKDPAFLFYSTDFYMGTVDMSDEQVGQYIRLMCLQHQKGHLTEQIMRKTMHGKLDGLIMSKFKVDENGCYYNVRLEEETEKRSRFTASRRRNLKGTHEDNTDSDTHKDNHKDSHKGKHTDSHKDNDKAIHMNSHKNTHMDSHMENENENEIEDTNEIEVERKRNLQTERFDEFWALYPKKVGKGAARKSWARIKPNKELHSKIISAVSEAKKSVQWQRENGRYIPNPATWLNQGRWEDELEGVNNNGNGINRQNTGKNNNSFSLTGFKPAGGED